MVSRIFFLLVPFVFVVGCQRFDVPHEANVSFATPEATLDRYIEGLRNADREQIAQCFHPPANGFYIPGPAPITRYKIKKKIVLADRQEPKFRPGDVELQVEEYLNEQPEMYSYWLRKFQKGWKIIDHTTWAEQDPPEEIE